jgi:thioredoxin-related protein
MKCFGLKAAAAAVALTILGGCASDSTPSPERPWKYGLVWLTDLPQAQAQAKGEKKEVFLEFTGSDWCPLCHALRAKVLDTAEFAEFARTNLVLVQIDFPKAKPLSEAVEKANDALATRFRIEEYPTVIVFDSDGNVLSRESSYDDLPVKDYVARLRKLRK